MKVRRDDGYVPRPDSPWSEIIHNLWMGGHYYRTPLGGLEHAVVRNQFEVVVSLYEEEGHGPNPDVEHHFSFVPDSALTPAQIAVVEGLAETVVGALRAGRRTLVRCHYGYNRSGLVVAQALIALGYDAPTAVKIIRERRSPFALHNQVFVEYLTAGLDIARLLSGLDESA
ncbi:protein-tyrosine phosphatase family protein [Yinghuangia seranimata]|uniref:protein-tyrosine phosphatase family protein n=1 Tax=Yinghuangia seranimata TaxID=408067 RepID=UPI00248C30A7|nr:protein phosphatase [Yinghuangia seranimata]MDI2127909.1 protein phosphatase [Yinghuangia seranimata]